MGGVLVKSKRGGAGFNGAGYRITQIIPPPGDQSDGNCLLTDCSTTAHAHAVCVGKGPCTATPVAAAGRGCPSRGRRGLRRGRLALV